MSLAQMYATKTSRVLKQFYKDYTWSIHTKEKVLYLTFDDGPHPEITPWVLEQLKKYDARATFFMVGANARKLPDLVKTVREECHAIGNHTEHHVNGWDVTGKEYFREILQCHQLLKTPLFRPPYGKIKRSQARALKQRFDIIMWDVLSWDFRPKVKPLQVYENVKKYAEPGSIVVFHDSEKAWRNLQFALPQVLRYFHDKGYRFDALIKSMDQRRIRNVG